MTPRVQMATVSARLGMTVIELTVPLDELEGTVVALAELSRALTPTYPELRETAELTPVGSSHAFDTSEYDDHEGRRRIGFTLTPSRRKN